MTLTNEELNREIQRLSNKIVEMEVTLDKVVESNHHLLMAVGKWRGYTIEQIEKMREGEET